MNLELAIAVLLIFCAASYLALGTRLVASKRAVGSLPIGLLLFVISVWVMGGAIELLSSTFTIFSLGRTGHFVGTALVPVVAYACFREYTGVETSTRSLALLLIIPTLSISLAATNVYHEAMWFLPIANEAGEFLTRPDKWGPWFLYVHLPFSYAVIGAAILTLIVHRGRDWGRGSVRVRVGVSVRGKVTCAAQLMPQQQQVGQRVLEELLVPG